MYKNNTETHDKDSITTNNIMDNNEMEIETSEKEGENQELSELDFTSAELHNCQDIIDREASGITTNNILKRREYVNNVIFICGLRDR